MTKLILFQCHTQVQLFFLLDIRNLKNHCALAMNADIEKCARNIKMNKEDAEAVAISIKLLHHNVNSLATKDVQVSGVRMRRRVLGLDRFAAVFIFNLLRTTKDTTIRLL